MGRVCVAWLFLGLALPVPLAAQATPEWSRPYLQAPEYWELVGRMFGESAGVNDDRSLKVITDPAVIGLASVKARAKPGETLALFAEVTYNTDANNQIDFVQPRLVVKEVREIRVVVTGRVGILVEWRSGSSSFQHKQCIDAAGVRLSYLVDFRLRAIVACQGGVVWSSWRREPGMSFTGTYTIDGWTTLELSYEPASDVVTVSLKKP